MPQDVRRLLEQFQESYLQLYGEVTANRLARLRQEGYQPMPVITIRNKGFTEQFKVISGAAESTSASAVVLDAYTAGKEGGTGKAFNWEWVAQARQEGRLEGWPRIILAGGLGPENVAEAVRIVRPWGVDVSSGVEIDGKPGRKDPERMRAFVQAARSAMA